MNRPAPDGFGWRGNPIGIDAQSRCARVDVKEKTLKVC